MRDENACSSLLAPPGILHGILKGAHARWAVVLNTYIDESDQGGLRVSSLAGYVFTPSACDEFEPRWKEVLNEPDPPLKRFHMNKWENRYPPFDTNIWTDEYRIYIYNKLVNIIHDTAMFSINVAIDSDAFDALDLEDRKILGGREYALAARWLVGMIHQWNKNGEPVQYFFDDIGPNRGKTEVIKELNRLKKTRYDISGHSWNNSTIVPEIQAADILTYEYTKEIANNLGKTDKYRPMRKSAELLVAAPTAPPVASITYDAAMLQYAIARLRQGKPLVWEEQDGWETAPPPELIALYQSRGCLGAPDGMTAQILLASGLVPPSILPGVPSSVSGNA